MNHNSIKSYDTARRVADYDTEMDLMHPARSKMIDIALEILPFEKESSFNALEFGTGTGYFTRRFLERFPNSNIIAVEGASSMVELAKKRLGKLVEKIDFRIGDFRNIDNLISKKEKGNIIFSSYSLHHLNKNEKLNTIKKAKDFLLPGGWIVNADLIIAENFLIEERFQKIRVDGIVERAKGLDKRLENYNSTRKFLNELEKKEGDQPITINEDLQILKNAGLKYPSIFWLEYREVVYGAVK